MKYSKFNIKIHGMQVLLAKAHIWVEDICEKNIYVYVNHFIFQENDNNFQ